MNKPARSGTRMYQTQYSACSQQNTAVSKTILNKIARIGTQQYQTQSPEQVSSQWNTDVSNTIFCMLIVEHCSIKNNSEQDSSHWNTAVSNTISCTSQLVIKHSCIKHNLLNKSARSGTQIYQTKSPKQVSTQLAHGSRINYNILSWNNTVQGNFPYECCQGLKVVFEFQGISGSFEFLPDICLLVPCCQLLCPYSLLHCQELEYHTPRECSRGKGLGNIP